LTQFHRHVAWVTIVFLTTALLLSACAVPPQDGSSGEEQWVGTGHAALDKLIEEGKIAPLKEPVTVKIAEDGSPSGAGFYIAKELGYFERLGINAEFVTFSSSAYMLPSLAAGQVDVAGGICSVSLFNAIKRGLDIKIIGDKGKNIPGQSYFDLVLSAERVDDIKTLADLKGEKIAVTSPGSVDELFADMALKAAGLTKDDVEYVILESFSEMNPALASGSVAATMHIEPLITQGEDKGILDRWVDATEFAPDFQVAIVLGSPQFVGEKRAIGELFMIGYVLGLRDYHEAFIKGEDTESIIEIMAEYTPMKDRELWHKVNVVGLSPNSEVIEESIAQQLQWFHDMGYFEDEVDLSTVIDMSLVDNAVELLGTYDTGE